ncbi:MAG: SDR family NAD(P)-dependent oxidoreductase [Negativicutes bacterium]|nr:SDR family NAD(P)-dependent oxidoreductase [Negativicutes bacterium]
MGEFTGKVVVVTGGSKGIGGAAVKRFCEEGAHCIIVSRNGQEGKAYAETLRQIGLSADAMAADVGKVSDIKQMAQDLVGRYGKIDVLVNCAGVNVRKPALEYNEEDWDYIMDINLKGSYFCSVEIGRHMVARGTGAIVNLASLQAHVVLPERTIYAASKGGVAQFTKGLANEWAQKGVRVNSISPAFIGTPMVAKVMDDPAWVQLIQSRTPMGRVGTPEEVADLIVFLASSRAGYITGTDVAIDGGWTAS